jgi:large subunit ribosomal protein L6
MSRIGRNPIVIPAGVTVEQNGHTLTVKGKNGELTQTFHPKMTIKIEDGVIEVTRPSDAQEMRSLHGLTRTLIANMIIGVSEGFKKDLEVHGVGYRVAKQGNNLVMTLGFSHQVIYPEEPGITIDAPAPNRIVVTGIDKQRVGQVAAEIREKRPPEPYKGKGIRYAGEVIVRKEGKAGKSKS